MQEYARFYEKSINFAPTLLRKPRSCTGEQCRSPVLPGFNLMGWYLIFNNEKRPKMLKFGRFVYIFVYKFRKSLKINVYCGENSSKTHQSAQCHTIPNTIENKGIGDFGDIAEYRTMPRKYRKFVYKFVYRYFRGVGRVHC